MAAEGTVRPESVQLVPNLRSDLRREVGLPEIPEFLERSELRAAADLFKNPVIKDKEALRKLTGRLGLATAESIIFLIIKSKELNPNLVIPSPTSDIKELTIYVKNALGKRQTKDGIAEDSPWQLTLMRRSQDPQTFKVELGYRERSAWWPIFESSANYGDLIKVLNSRSTYQNIARQLSHRYELSSEEFKLKMVGLGWTEDHGKANSKRSAYWKQFGSIKAIFSFYAAGNNRIDDWEFRVEDAGRPSLHFLLRTQRADANFETTLEVNGESYSFFMAKWIDFMVDPFADIIKLYVDDDFITSLEQQDMFETVFHFPDQKGLAVELVPLKEGTGYVPLKRSELRAHVHSHDFTKLDPSDEVDDSTELVQSISTVQSEQIFDLLRSDESGFLHKDGRVTSKLTSTTRSGDLGLPRKYALFKTPILRYLRRVANKDVKEKKWWNRSLKWVSQHKLVVGLSVFTLVFAAATFSYFHYTNPAYVARKALREAKGAELKIVINDTSGAQFRDNLYLQEQIKEALAYSNPKSLRDINDQIVRIDIENEKDKKRYAASLIVRNDASMDVTIERRAILDGHYDSAPEAALSDADSLQQLILGDAYEDFLFQKKVVGLFYTVGASAFLAMFPVAIAIWVGSRNRREDHESLTKVAAYRVRSELRNDSEVWPQEWTPEHIDPTEKRDAVAYLKALYPRADLDQRVAGEPVSWHQENISELAKLALPYVEDGDIWVDFSSGPGTSAIQFLQEVERAGKKITLVMVDVLPSWFSVAYDFFHNRPDIKSDIKFYLLYDAKNRKAIKISDILPKKAKGIFSGSTLHLIPETKFGEVMKDLSESLQDNGTLIFNSGDLDAPRPGNVGLLHDPYRMTRSLIAQDPYYIHDYLAKLEPEKREKVEKNASRIFLKPHSLEMVERALADAGFFAEQRFFRDIAMRYEDSNEFMMVPRLAGIAGGISDYALQIQMIFKHLSAVYETLQKQGQADERGYTSRWTFGVYKKEGGVINETPAIDRSELRRVSGAMQPGVNAISYDGVFSNSNHYTRQAQTQLRTAGIQRLVRKLQIVPFLSPHGSISQTPKKHMNTSTTKKTSKDRLSSLPENMAPAIPPKVMVTILISRARQLALRFSVNSNIGIGSWLIVNSRTFAWEPKPTTEFIKSQHIIDYSQPIDNKSELRAGKAAETINENGLPKNNRLQKVISTYIVISALALSNFLIGLPSHGTYPILNIFTNMFIFTGFWIVTDFLGQWIAGRGIQWTQTFWMLPIGFANALITHDSYFVINQALPQDARYAVWPAFGLASLTAVIFSWLFLPRRIFVPASLVFMAGLYALTLNHISLNHLAVAGPRTFATFIIVYLRQFVYAWMVGKVRHSAARTEEDKSEALLSQQKKSESYWMMRLFSLVKNYFIMILPPSVQVAVEGVVTQYFQIFYTWSVNKKGFWIKDADKRRIIPYLIWSPVILPVEKLLSRTKRFVSVPIERPEDPSGEIRSELRNQAEENQKSHAGKMEFSGSVPTIPAVTFIEDLAKTMPSFKGLIFDLQSPADRWFENDRMRKHVVATKENILKLKDTRGRAFFSTRPNQEVTKIHSVTLSKDQTKLGFIADGKDGKSIIGALDARTGKQLFAQVLTLSNRKFKEILEFDPSGEHLLALIENKTGPKDPTVFFYYVPSGNLARTVHLDFYFNAEKMSFGKGYPQIAISPDGQLLAIGHISDTESRANQVWVYDLKTSRSVILEGGLRFSNPKPGLNSLIFLPAASPDQYRVAAVARNEQVVYEWAFSRSELRVTIRDIAIERAPSVVGISGTYKDDEQFHREGVGVVVGEDADDWYIVTNRHVISILENINVAIVSGDGHILIPANVYKRDTEADLALIKVPKASIPSNMQIDKAILLPSEFGLTVSDGDLANVGTFGSTFSPYEKKSKGFSIDGASPGRLFLKGVLEAGASGSPVFDHAGFLIGVYQSISGEQDDIDASGTVISYQSIESFLSREKVPGMKTNEIGNVASKIQEYFDQHQNRRQQLEENAQRIFETYDWHERSKEDLEIMDLYPITIEQLLEKVRALSSQLVGNIELWRKIKLVHHQLIKNYSNAPFAMTFFNSFARRFLSHYVSRVMYTPQEIAAAEHIRKESSEPISKEYVRTGSIEDLLVSIFDDYSFDIEGYEDSRGYQNLRSDINALSKVIVSYLTKRKLKPKQIYSIEISEGLLFRNKSAYMLGKIKFSANQKHSSIRIPFVFRLRNEISEKKGSAVQAKRLGVFIDRNGIFLGDQLPHHVFTFSRAALHVNTPNRFSLVDFLHTLIPRKDVHELYWAIGDYHYARSKFYEHYDTFTTKSEEFEKMTIAPGIEGTVMMGLTFPGFDHVLKIARDSFAQNSGRDGEPLNIQNIHKEYDRVRKMDRAGRFLDALRFGSFRIPVRFFDPLLLKRLLEEASGVVSIQGDDVIIRSFYVQKRLMPAILYLDLETDPEKLANFIDDYGRMIREVGAVGIYVKNFPMRNFGVNSNGRLISYDPGDISRLVDWHFMSLEEYYDKLERRFGEMGPSDEDASAIPSIIGIHTTIPENIIDNIPNDPPFLRELFRELHGELLTVKYWNDLKARHQSKEVIDVIPASRFKAKKKAEVRSELRANSETARKIEQASISELTAGREINGKLITFNEPTVKAFALDGDQNPYHLDEAFANNSVFKGRVAHGLLMLSKALYRIQTELPAYQFDPHHPIVITNFKKPVLIGETARIAGKVESVSNDGGSALVKISIYKNREGETEVLAAEALTRMVKRPAGKPFVKTKINDIHYQTMTRKAEKIDAQFPAEVFDFSKPESPRVRTQTVNIEWDFLNNVEALFGTNDPGMVQQLTFYKLLSRAAFKSLPQHVLAEVKDVLLDKPIEPLDELTFTTQIPEADKIKINGRQAPEVDGVVTVRNQNGERIGSAKIKMVMDLTKKAVPAEPHLTAESVPPAKSELRISRNLAADFSSLQAGRDLQNTFPDIFQDAMDSFESVILSAKREESARLDPSASPQDDARKSPGISLTDADIIVSSRGATFSNGLLPVLADEARQGRQVIVIAPTENEIPLVDVANLKISETNDARAKLITRVDSLEAAVILLGAGANAVYFADTLPDKLRAEAYFKAELMTPLAIERRFHDYPAVLEAISQFHQAYEALIESA